MIQVKFWWLAISRSKGWIGLGPGEIFNEHSTDNCQSKHTECSYKSDWNTLYSEPGKPKDTGSCTSESNDKLCHVLKTESDIRMFECSQVINSVQAIWQNSEHDFMSWTPAAISRSLRLMFLTQIKFMYDTQRVGNLYWALICLFMQVFVYF